LPISVILQNREIGLHSKRKEEDDMAVKKVGGKRKSSEKDPGKEVRFQFPAPEVKEVYLTGDFNDWNTKSHPMKKDKNGDWEISISLQPGRYEYRFFVDGIWQNDTCGEGFVANSFGTLNCVKIVE
jgi:1,4-alpha-glucan branching enzyme